MKNFVFFSSIIFYCNCCFIENENNFISALSSELLITHIIMINQTCDIFDKMLQLKHYSLNNIHTAYMNFSGLLSYLSSKRPFDMNMMIIFKIESNEGLQTLSEVFNEELTKVRINPAYKWMLLTPRNKEIAITEKTFYIPFNCQYFLARETLNGYEIFEIYQIKKNTNMIYKSFGIWDEKIGLKTTAISFYNDKQNMKGTPIIVSTILGEPCLSNVHCFHEDMIHDFSKIFNFTRVSINISEEGKTPPDISGKITLWNPFNSKMNNDIGPLVRGRWHFYIRHEVDKRHGWRSYFKPFSSDLWVTIGALLLVTGFIKVIIGKVASTISKLTDYTLLDQGLIPLTIFCNQAITYGPKIVSSRIARFSVQLLSGVIVPAYSAAIISSLTVHIPQIPFTDFDSFAQDGTYKLVSIAHPVILAFFQYSKNPFIKIIREKYLVPYEDFCRSTEKCVDLVCNERIAIAAFNYKVLQLASPCRISEIPETLFTFYTAIDLGEETSFRRILMKSLIRFRQIGIFQRLETKEYSHNEFYTEKLYRPINLRIAAFTLVVLITGILLSWFVLICEISWWNLKRLRHTTFLRNDHEISTSNFKKGSRKRVMLTKRFSWHAVYLED